MSPKRVGFLVFDGMMALDLFGPIDAFMTANALGASNGESRYDLITIGLSRKPVTTESGVRLLPARDIRNAPALDTLIIPGGEGLRRPKVDRQVSAWLRRRAAKTRRMVSVCTGVHALASAGLLDGCEVATHWRFAAQIARRFPKLRVNPSAIFVKDGSFYTSAGVTAGIDLSLALIAEDYGPALALAVARDLIVYLKRPGGQEQFSEPLQFQVRSMDKFADLVGWIVAHLSEDLSSERLAQQTAYSPRHFRRLFKETFGQTPADFVEQLRLNEARHRLSLSRSNIDSVADSLGFKSRSVFSRAFERRFGVRPRVYRHSFHLASN